MVLPETTRAISRMPKGRTACRRGSLIVEAVIGLVLLATATVALTRLAKSSAALTQQSDQRLTATLAAENTIERLRAVDADQLAAESAAVADLVANETGCAIEVSSDSFKVGNRSGIHLRVDASISPATQIRLHDWRFELQSSGESDSAGDETSADGGDDNDA